VGVGYGGGHREVGGFVLGLWSAWASIVPKHGAIGCCVRVRGSGGRPGLFGAVPWGGGLPGGMWFWRSFSSFGRLMESGVVPGWECFVGRRWPNREGRMMMVIG